jgi:hypothetical protein
MSLPGDSLPNTAPAVGFLSPDSIVRANRIIDYERGGIGIQDPSQGMDVRDWTAELVGTDVRLYPSESPASYVVLFSAAGITQISLSFDANMRAAVAFVAFNQAKLWWYDATGGGVTTTILDADVRSPVLSFDDKRPFSTTTNVSDILLFYIRSNRLCYRQQRERFQTERTLAWFDGSMLSVRRAGMSTGLRMQVEVVGLSNRLAVGAVLAGWREAAYLASVTSISGNMPPDILAGDLLYAALLHRSAVTPPAGWSLVAFKDCVQGAVTQTLSLLKKTTPTPADSGASASFSQASSGLMGLAYFNVRATAGTPVLLASSTTGVDDTETNTVTAPALTAAGTELFVMLATSIVATASVTQPSVSAGLGPFGGRASECRIGMAYQRRSVGQSNPGRFTFDNGTPINNGLAAMTLRFGTT